MSAYVLRLSFAQDDGSKRQALELVMLDAETDGAAIATATRMVHETYDRPLQAAILRSKDGRVVWSLRSSPAAANGVAEV